MFTFHLIRTLADARALPPGTIGIEITDPEMAQAILDAGGSNLDGQHGVPCGIGSAREVPFSGSAVELALAFADSVLMGGHHYHVAFQRPDLDACAAAALLVLRALDIPRGLHWSRETPERVALIARADSFRTDGMRWEDWAPPAPTLECPFPASQYTTVDGSGELAAVAAICSPNPRTGQPQLPLGERVAICALWLLWGSRYMMDPWAITDSDADCLLVDRITSWCGCAGDGLSASELRALGCYHPRAQHFADEIRRSQTMTLDARLALIRESTIDRFDDSGLWVASDDSCIAVVRSRHAGVSALGYSRDRGAPVFVAIPPDDGGPKKVTIATCSAAYLDDPALKAALNAAELAAGGVPKWGGPAGMACSPQHEGTVLDDETIIAAVCAARRNK